MGLAGNDSWQAHAHFQVIKLGFGGAGDHVCQFAHGIGYVGVDLLELCAEHCAGSVQCNLAAHAEHDHSLGLAGKSD